MSPYPNLTGLTAAFTGHRPPKLGGYSEKVDSQLIALATIVMQECKPSKVITGMALGWDQAVAYAAIRAHITVIAALPFHGQENLWPQHSKDRYKAILNKCDEIVVVSQGDYAAVKMQIRNQWMVNKGDHLMSLWNGTQGGTMNCVEYALKQRKPVYQLWKAWQAMVGGRTTI